LYRLKSCGTQTLQIIPAIRENGQCIIRAQSFQTLRGNEWLDSDVSDSGEKMFVSSGDSRIKKVGDHCGAREKVRGAT